jgi:streptomycin 3"-adenylyltransferase
VNVASEPARFTEQLARELNAVAGAALVGVYLHGSAALADWRPTGSDVDVLVVVTETLGDDTAHGIAASLAYAEPPRCPGAGLECSVVEAGAASHPAAPWPFIVHVTTAPDDRKTVWCAPGAGDDDLILRYLDARLHAHVTFGPPPEEVFGPVETRDVRAHLARDLRWAVDHASESYAVLNACRALRYSRDETICSKSDGGTWAFEHGIEPALVHRALEQRLRGERAAVTTPAREWVEQVAEQVAGYATT